MLAQHKNLEGIHREIRRIRKNEPEKNVEILPRISRVSRFRILHFSSRRDPVNDSRENSPYSKFN